MKAKSRGRRTQARAAMLAMAAACTVIAGCGGGSGGGFVESGTLRFVNAVPDSLPLDVFVQNTAFARVGYGFAQSPTPIAALNLRLDVRFTDSAGTANSVLQAGAVQVNANRDTTVFIAGELADADILVVRNELADIPAGEAEFRFVHVGTRRNDVELFLTAPNDDLAGAMPRATLDFRETSDLLRVPAGMYRIRARAVGAPDILFDSGAFNLADQSRRIFAVIDYFGPGDSPLRVIRIDNVGAGVFAAEAFPSSARLANFVADTTTVDGSLDDGVAPTAIDDVPFPSVTDPVVLAATSYDVTVIADNDPGNMVYQANQSLVSGESHTLVLAGTAANAIRARWVRDQTRPIASEASLDVVHAAPAEDSVDFYLVEVGAGVSGNTPLFRALPPLASAELQITPGSYDVLFTRATTTDVVAGPVTVDLAARGLYGIYSHEAAGGGAPLEILFDEQGAP